VTAGLVLREETAGDLPAIEALVADAFADDGATLVRLVELLRTTPAPLEPTSLVAISDGRMVGHVMLSASRLDAPRRLVDVLVLAPLGVATGFQGRGAGGELVRAALAAAETRGVPLVFLIGEPEYYGRFGFEPAAPLGFRKPSLRIPDEAFQVVRLLAWEPWMTGTLVFADPFWAMDCVGLRDPEA
jgi:putative acetyltransferase